MNNFDDFLNLIAEGKKVAIESNPGKKLLKELEKNLHSSNPFIVEQKDTVKKEIIIDSVEESNSITEEVLNEIPEVKPASQVYSEPEIDKYLRRNASFQQPDPNVVDPNTKAIQEKLKFLEQAVGRIAATGPGSGEVNLRYLDDVDRSTIGEGRHLAYNATTKKFFFEEVSTGSNLVSDAYTTEISDNVISVINLPNEVIGPIQGIAFDVAHEHASKDPGTLCWNADDRTLNIQHPNDITQQVGQETYMLVRNNTGSQITNGSCVRFAGTVGVDGVSRILAAPFLANGTYPSLYAIGIATENIANGADGFITVFGNVRKIDATGSSVGETWTQGNILYAHPTIAGALTNVKPTAPYNVVPMGALLIADAIDGQIFVRPTIEQKYSYGRFARTTDVTVSDINTAYAVVFNSTETSNGVSTSTPASRLIVDQSGLYQIDINAQVEISGSASNTGTMSMWIRKNGVDVPNSMRRQGMRAEVPSLSFSYNIVISLQTNEYIEVMYASDDTAMIFDATAATTFGPTTSALLVGVTQIQL